MANGPLLDSFDTYANTAALIAAYNGTEGIPSTGLISLNVGAGRRGTNSCLISNIASLLSYIPGVVSLIPGTSTGTATATLGIAVNTAANPLGASSNIFEWEYGYNTGPTAPYSGVIGGITLGPFGGIGIYDGNNPNIVSYFGRNFWWNSSWFYLGATCTIFLIIIPPIVTINYTITVYVNNAYVGTKAGGIGITIGSPPGPYNFTGSKLSWNQIGLSANYDDYQTTYTNDVAVTDIAGTDTIVTTNVPNALDTQTYIDVAWESPSSLRNLRDSQTYIEVANLPGTSLILPSYVKRRNAPGH